MFDPQEYTIIIKKIVLDGETLFEATVTELPDVAEYGDHFEKVYKLAIDTIQTAMEKFAQNGQPFPPPLPRLEEDEYNGYIFLQLPNSLHREIAAVAQQEQMGVNEYVLFVLSQTGKRKNVPLVTKNYPMPSNRSETKLAVKSNRSKTQLGAIKP